MLKGVVVRKITEFCDERGFFAELMREDWNDFIEERPPQANFSKTYPGLIRAWHRHVRGQEDYFIVLKGTLKICAYDEETKELNEIISTGNNLQIVRIPGHYWHGFKVVGDEIAYLLYFTTRLYDKKDPDEERRAWDDQDIVPESINGDKEDPRTGKPWDWNYPPHR
jgi:dTDP-4-dehydrorhamnose 3,5-epimerase